MAEEEDEDEEVAGLEEEYVCATGAPAWVVTFGDMMSLLLTFFILLLSFATMDVLRFKELSGSIKQAFGVMAPTLLDPIPKAETHVVIESNVDYNAKNIMQELRRKLDPKSMKRKQAKVDVEVFETYRGVVVLLSGEDLFEGGTERLKPSAKVLLDFIAEQARDEGDYELAVEARSPSSSPRAPQFKDTWALTSARSLSAANYLRVAGGLIPRNVLPVGRGPAPPDRAPGSKRSVTGPTLEFIFLSRKMKGK